MDEQERQQILTLLDESRAALESAVAGVVDETARRIPGPGRWSILGCAEHIAFSEDYMFAQIGIATTSETPLINRERRGQDAGSPAPTARAASSHHPRAIPRESSPRWPRRWRISWPAARGQLRLCAITKKIFAPNSPGIRC